MSTLEILEAHRIGSSFFLDHGLDKFWCYCGAEFTIRAGDSDTAILSFAKHQATMLDQHMREREAKLRQLIRDMTDPGDCWFDHRGGCQEHGYLDLNPGELCPHMEAKQLLGMEEPTNGR